MNATSIRLPTDVLARLQALAQLTGHSQAELISEAILEHLGDLEDLYLSEARLIEVRAGRSKMHSLADVERRLRLVSEL